MLKINEVTSLYLGVQGENQARTIQIDMAEWLAGHPNAAVSIWHRINGTVEFQPTGALLDLETGILSWSPLNSDTAHDGQGDAEVRLTESGIIKKTKKITTLTSPSPTLDGSVIGSGWQEYINAIEEMKAAAVAAKNRSEEIVEDVAAAIAADILDDTTGAGETHKSWSADKLVTEFGTKADEDDVETGLALRTKFTDVYAGCEEYTPASEAYFIYGRWYHEVGTKYICTLQDKYKPPEGRAGGGVGFGVSDGVIHLPTETNDKFLVFTICDKLKETSEDVQGAYAAAEEAKEQAEAAAQAANGLYLDTDGDLCQGDPET